MYARSLVSCYVSKVADLSESILNALERLDFLTYAPCGRALIEIVAILRYYIEAHYKPLLDKKSLSPDDIRTLIDIDDRHLRGSRFDWESFLFSNYSKLRNDAVQQLSEKRQARFRRNSEELVKQQVNIKTCIEKWASDTPEVLIAYDLFCDLVHPNIGSNFLIASAGAEGLRFVKHRGEMVGHRIFEQSFPILLSVTHRPLGDYLTLLTATCWHDDELGECNATQ